MTLRSASTSISFLVLGRRFVIKSPPNDQRSHHSWCRAAAGGSQDSTSKSPRRGPREDRQLTGGLLRATTARGRRIRGTEQISRRTYQRVSEDGEPLCPATTASQCGSRLGKLSRAGCHTIVVVGLDQTSFGWWSRTCTTRRMRSSPAPLHSGLKPRLHLSLRTQLNQTMGFGSVVSQPTPQSVALIVW